MHSLRSIVILVTFVFLVLVSDFGFASSIAGKIWSDSNRDGVKDQEELGIAGVEVSLYDLDQNVIQSLSSRADGQYQFSELPLDDYIVCFGSDSQLTEQQITDYKAAGHDAFDSDANPSDGCTEFIRTSDNALNVFNIDLGLLDNPDLAAPEQSASASTFVEEPIIAAPVAQPTRAQQSVPRVEAIETSTVQSATGSTSVESVVDNLPAGEWAAVAGSQRGFIRACPSTTDVGPHTQYLAKPRYKWNFYCAGLINAENGATFDTKNNRMIVWGGGHADYAGNEVYSFNISGPNQGWQRLNLPSPLPASCDMNGGRSCPGIDNIEYLSKSPSQPNVLVPTSRHTFDGLQYLPNLGEKGSLWSFAGSVWQGGGVSAATWFFDTETLQWTEKSRWDGSAPTPNPDDPRPTNILQAHDIFTAYDPETDYLYAHGNRRLKRYDYKTDTWTLLSDDRNLSSISVHSSAAMDYEHKKIVVIGGSPGFAINPSYYVLGGKVSDPQARLHHLASTGASEIETSNAPGIAYDPEADVFVAWQGGRSVYVLDMEHGEPNWQKIELGGADPGTQTVNGTFGRLQYVPSKRAFILVNKVAVEEDGFTLINNQVQANVFFFKLPESYYDNVGKESPVVAANSVSQETNTGTPQQTIKHLFPTGNISDAMHELIPGDTLIVHEGEYAVDKRISLSERGTAQAPIIIKAAAGEARPKITTSPTIRQNTFNIEGSASHITIRGLEITNATYEDAIKIADGKISHITLENLNIHDVSIGIRVATDTHHLRIRNNNIHHTGRPRRNESGQIFDTSTGEGMYIGCYAGDCIVRDSIIEKNLVHDSYPAAEQGDGIEIKPRSHSNIVRDNVVYHMGGDGGGYGGILVWGWEDEPETANWKDNVVERNVVWGHGKPTDVGIEAISHVIVRNNIVFNTTTGLASNPQFDGSTNPPLEILVKDVQFINNTVYNVKTGARLIWDEATNSVFANNVIHSNRSNQESSAILCWPHVQGRFAGNIIQGEFGCKKPANGFIRRNNLKQAFLGVDDKNFWLSDNSVLKGKGAKQFAPQDDFNKTKRNGPIDVGAYQVGGDNVNPGWKIEAGRFKRP